MNRTIHISEADRDEVLKFVAVLKIEASRKSGGDPHVCNMLEAALYPEGIGRVPADGSPDA